MTKLAAAALALLGAVALTSCTRTTPAQFYLVDINSDHQGQLHVTGAAAKPGGKLPLVFFDDAAGTCCFVPGAPFKSDEAGARSLSREGEESHAWNGRYQPTKKRKDDEWGGIAFGFAAMQAVRRIDTRTHEVTFGDGAPPVYVRSCTTGEGLRIELLHGAKDAKPYADYYYSLGIDMEPDCPDMQAE
jgi:hypothetical protein